MYNAGKRKSKEGSNVNLKKGRTVEIPVLFQRESVSQNVMCEFRNMARLSVLFVRVKLEPNFVGLLTSGSSEEVMKHHVGYH
jgi:hypothetical protein